MKDSSAYAQSMAISFAEWIVKNKWVRCGKKWAIPGVIGEKTTTELYKMFKVDFYSVIFRGHN